MAGGLSYQGVNVDQAYTTLASAGIQAEAARNIIGIWIGEAIRSGRSFGYSHAFPATDAACSPAAFARGFVHQDWIDGESAVQAGETPTEDGFNTRFHKIEQDLDRLGALVAQAFTCMNAMRSTLAGSLGEVASELNRLNADVAELRRGGAVATPVGPIGQAGSGYKFVGKTKYFDKQVMVWSDPDGRLVNLPDPTVINLPRTADLRAPKVAEVLGRDGDIREAFAGSLTKRELVQRFGDRLTGDGQSLGDVLKVLPDEQVFADLNAVVTTLGEQDVFLLKGLGMDATVRADIGVQPGGIATEAPVARLEGMTPALNSALAEAGIKTIKDFNGLSSDRVVEIGRGRGLDVGRGLAGGLLARGRVIGGL